MQLQTTENYLRQISHALDTVIAPDLQTAEAKAAVAAIQGGLRELLRRQRDTPALLAGLIEEGLGIADGLFEVLGENVEASLRAERERLQAAPARPMDYDAQRERYNALNLLLESLTAAAADLRSSAAAAAVGRAIAALLRRAAEWEYRYLSEQRQPVAFEAYPGLAEGTPELDQDRLLEFLRGQPAFADAERVTQFSKIPGGMSKHTYAVALAGSRGETELIVRKSDANVLFDVGAFEIGNEFHLLRALHVAGFPVPHPLLLGENVPGADAKFFVMERVKGTVPGTLFGASAIPEALLFDLADTFARLHTLGLEPFADYIRAHDSPQLLQISTREAYRLQIEHWRRYTERNAMLPSCGKVYMLDWLLHNIPDNDRPPVLVHGDLNVHNFLAEGDRITAVLDWECALFGDPAQDLAYVKANIEKHMEWSRFMARYYAAGGPPIDESSFGYYQAFANTRLVIGALRALEFFRTGRRRHPRVMALDGEFLPLFMRTVLEGTF